MELLSHSKAKPEMLPVSAGDFPLAVAVVDWPGMSFGMSAACSAAIRFTPENLALVKANDPKST